MQLYIYFAWKKSKRCLQYFSPRQQGSCPCMRHIYEVFVFLPTFRARLQLFKLNIATVCLFWQVLGTNFLRGLLFAMLIVCRWRVSHFSTCVMKVHTVFVLMSHDDRRVRSCRFQFSWNILPECVHVVKYDCLCLFHEGSHCLCFDEP